MAMTDSRLAKLAARFRVIDPVPENRQRGILILPDDGSGDGLPRLPRPNLQIYLPNHYARLAADGTTEAEALKKAIAAYEAGAADDDWPPIEIVTDD